MCQLNSKGWIINCQKKKFCFVLYRLPNPARSNPPTHFLPRCIESKAMRIGWRGGTLEWWTTWMKRGLSSLCCGLLPHSPPEAKGTVMVMIVTTGWSSGGILDEACRYGWRRFDNVNVKEPKANGGIGDGHYWMRFGWDITVSSRVGNVWTMTLSRRLHFCEVAMATHVNIPLLIKLWIDGGLLLILNTLFFMQNWLGFQWCCILIFVTTSLYR